jgi:hypothetical protein
MKKKSIVDELFKLGVDIFDSVYFLIKKTNQIDFFIYIYSELKQSKISSNRSILIWYNSFFKDKN